MVHGIWFMVLLFGGSALGGVARHWVSGRMAHPTPGRLPAGTLFVNWSGAFLIGMIHGLARSDSLSPEYVDLLTFGFLGGYTTVSSFSLNTLHLVQSGKFGLAGLNVTVSVIVCHAAAVCGLLLGSHTLAAGFLQ